MKIGRLNEGTKRRYLDIKRSAISSPFDLVLGVGGDSVVFNSCEYSVTEGTT